MISDKTHMIGDRLVVVIDAAVCGALTCSNGLSREMLRRRLAFPEVDLFFSSVCRDAHPGDEIISFSATMILSNTALNAALNAGIAWKEVFAREKNGSVNKAAGATMKAVVFGSIAAVFYAGMNYLYRCPSIRNQGVHQGFF